MTRPRRSTIYVKKRAVMVERKSARPTKWQTHKKVVAWKAAQIGEQAVTGLTEVKSIAAPVRSIYLEVARCLEHQPLAFPRKLWGEVL